MTGYTLHHGDCLEVLPTLEADSVDTVILDPPAGIAFMGKRWDNLTDHGAQTERGRMVEPMLSAMVECGALERWAAGFLLFTVDWASETLRVAKPGATALVWAIPRTSDLTKFGVRLAGWEVKDTIYHLFGSGFPKSLSIDKAIDKAAGAEREVVGERVRLGDKQPYPHNATSRIYGKDNDHIRDGMRPPITAPATPAAQQWHGWGTALKPAAEEWIVAMKPRAGTFAENALRYGVAGLWVDGARVAHNETAVFEAKAHKDNHGGKLGGYDGGWKRIIDEIPQGRWPANVVLDGEAAQLLDEQAGERPSGEIKAGQPQGVNFQQTHRRVAQYDIPASTGGASRFFYCAKSSRRERNEGLPEGMTNGHPTVKPLSLMRWLCRLTKTPTGGVVLDPFMGSGSTGYAAVMEGREFIGIELDAGYCEIARRRIAHAAKQPRQLTLEGVQP